ncbi:MAG: CAP domain-containing protein [Thaumarchaeota archaeon]|nr:CAP domain-containing protein [Nitrososphaerota archaeon]
MKKCRHHYEWYDGKLRCARCGHRKWLTYGVKRKITTVIIGTVVLVAVFLAYQNIGLITNNVNHTQETLVKQLPNLTAQFSAPLHSVEPQIIKTVSNLSNSIPHTIQEPITVPMLKPKISISELELKIHNGINQQRQDQGLNPLVYDSKIADVARIHSQDMATRNYFEHDTPEGVSPSQRGINAGYSSCGDRQAIADSQEYDRLSKQFEATGNTDQNMYNQLQILYNKVNSEISNGMLFEGFPENIEENNLYDYIEYTDGVPFYHWLSEDQLSDSIVQTWMNSSGHRHNILTPAYYSEGIGVAIASDNKVYITEDFC